MLKAETAQLNFYLDLEDKLLHLGDRIRFNHSMVFAFGYHFSYSLSINHTVDHEARIHESEIDRVRSPF
jgi:hypothetical protein